MARPFEPADDCNPGDAPTIHDLSDPRRRVLLQGGVGALARWLAPALPAGVAGAAALLAGGCATPTAAPGGGRLGFESIDPGDEDSVRVPPGYTADVLAPWGEPVGVEGRMPAWKPDGSNTAAEQALQMGMHHDGMQFYALGGDPHHGLLVMNHEYVDDGLLHPDGPTPWTVDKVAKAQAAHGISVIEVQRDVMSPAGLHAVAAMSEAAQPSGPVAPAGAASTPPAGTPGGPGEWRVLRPSLYARRITARTPCVLQGPVSGHALVRTAADPTGRTVLGTLNNCAAGRTPWGTCLSGEENFAYYFDGGDHLTRDQKRYAMRPRGWNRWAEHDERFDASVHPNEFHRFGWVVEVDPLNPQSVPVKRTALGRAAHEGAWVAVSADNRAVVYSGEDAKFEYIYKFVSRDTIQPGSSTRSAAEANRELLDDGTLHVARFDADGTGVWLPLVHGRGPLTAANGFPDQASVLVRLRQAADLLGATRMDRPEWLAIDQAAGTVWCTLTNNSDRGKPGQPGVDAANPRAVNTMGQIIQWQETAGFEGTTMRWQHLLLAGDPQASRPEAQGNVRGDAFACPDGLLFDPRGVLWIQTDVGSGGLGRGDYERLGHNQMLACDLSTGEVRRFLTGPAGCEITGATLSPDGTTLFVNIQHPGEAPQGANDPTRPLRWSSWPDGPQGGRPRSATVAVRRKDGGLVGT